MELSKREICSPGQLLPKWIWTVRWQTLWQGSSLASMLIGKSNSVAGLREFDASYKRFIRSNTPGCQIYSDLLPLCLVFSLIPSVFSDQNFFPFILPWLIFFQDSYLLCFPLHSLSPSSLFQFSFLNYTKFFSCLITRVCF